MLFPFIGTTEWKRMRIHGSRRIYPGNGSVVRISVPVHGESTLERGLQTHPMKLSGIDESEL